MRFLIGALVLACASLIGGCATNTRATHQRIDIQSVPPGANVLILPSGEEIETPASVELRRDTALTLFVEKDGYRSTRVYLDRETHWWALLPYTDNLFHLVPNPVNIVLEPQSAESAASDGAIPNGRSPRTNRIRTRKWSPPNPSWRLHPIPHRSPPDQSSMAHSMLPRHIRLQPSEPQNR